MTALIEELKSSRPIPPSIQWSILDEDDKFGAYLAGLMRDLPNFKKLYYKAK